MKKFILMTLMLMLAQESYSSGRSEGKIKWIRVRAQDNLHYFAINATHTTPPGCAGTNESWTIKDENSLAGKTQISMLLAAWASKRTVVIRGAGTCTRSGGIEDTDLIYIDQK